MSRKSKKATGFKLKDLAHKLPKSDMVDQMNLPSILYELTNNKLSKFYNQTPGTVLDTIGNENA